MSERERYNLTWLATALKFAPTVVKLGEIAVSALPHFTQRRGEAIEAAEKATQQQISELQSAATTNAENIRTLAADLEAAIKAVEDGAKGLDNRYRRLARLTYLALSLAASAVLGLLAILLR